MTTKRTKLIFRSVCCAVAMAFVQEQSLAQTIVLANNQTTGQQRSRSELKKTVALTEVLQNLQAEYNVSFLYEKKNLEGKYISTSQIAYSDKIENTLGKVLPGTELTFEKINSKTYAIVSGESNTTNLTAANTTGKSETEKLDYFNLLFVDYNKSNRPDVINYRAKTAPVWQISGKVASANGEGMPGVTVLLKGTSTGATTSPDGNYTLSVPEAPGTLVFSFIGFTTQEKAFTGPGTVNVTLAEDATALEEVVVTGYTSEKKRDIIGSVSVVKPTELLQTPAANLQAQLQGRASGVTVSGNGQPGAGAKVRIRGFASFGNNDPLYVIDGVPTDNPSTLNPQDIESLQVLKDATSASIYGSRAANGVIIVTTKRGKAGTSSISFDSYAGVQVIPESSMPEMLNTEQYGQYLFTSRKNGGVPTTSPIFGSGANPVVPGYLIISPAYKGGVAADDPRANPSNYNLAIGDANKFYQILKTSPGTNWFKEITQPARIQSHQLSASGGTEKGTYALGVNYFNQEGTIVNTGYDRFTVRANTTFNPVKRIRIGENLQVSYEDRQGGSEAGEGGAWAQAYRMVPYLPVYDINGGFAGNGVTESGNGSSPIANLARNKDNKQYGYKVFGNVYGEVDILKNLTARTSFGIDYTNEYRGTYNAVTYERSENNSVDAFTERFGYFNTWTWTNTLTYNQKFGENHSLKVLGGVEAIKGSGRGINASNTGYDFGQVVDFRSIQTGNGIRSATTYNIGQNIGGLPIGGASSLYSLFSRVDYGFRDKYLFNATIRRDASSKFGPLSRVAVFPAFGAAWRISDEAFMQSLPVFTELKLRGGWGQMGSQRNVDAINQFTTFASGQRESWYAIDGQNNGSTTGYRQSRLGNLTSKWETTETTNIGLDASFLNGRFNVTVEGYNIETKDLLIEQVRNNLSPEIDQPRVNVGNMRNRGFDINLGTTGNFAGDFRYDASLNFTRYTNEITKLAEEGQIIYLGASRLGNVIAIEKGHPMSSFFGYQVDGIFQNQAEVDAGPAMQYKTVGSWRLKDLNGDNKIDDADRTHIGNPIPKFQLGGNLSLAYKNFDISTFLFWNYGNDLFNFTRWFTDLRGFVGGVSTRVLENSWTPQNPGATLPIISSKDTYSSSISSSYFVEKGSYFRMRTLQIGYKMPASFANKLRLNNFRVYLQGQNLFTITKYTGADPDISIVGDNNATDNDRFMGVDQANYPNSRQFIIGINLGF
ncbi:SusC/RagA family TonB-linked outer membrane protein [Adhaeribacter pallidiroseus]|uniref:TonB-dependent receptor SusC n=1 Tax=Adhaeribacter pallidiroseus TaxID=2072847 RepID=A0A369QA57_9BACT|nr:TonB-dependent receptor [Adhaeribacter pallidiroseus]RDC61783.1 TonB-dependent receptor SusC [Adhaeribacter pallidiroseus]